jgi:hypothetical protein
MQYEVKNLISDITGRAGITGPIPNMVEERKKKEPVLEVPPADPAVKRKSTRFSPGQKAS